MSLWDTFMVKELQSFCNLGSFKTVARSRGKNLSINLGFQKEEAS